MDVTKQLQAYTTQIVALGQATLAHRRRGEWLPDELAAQAVALLALESELAAALAAVPSETTTPDEVVAAPLAATGVTTILDGAALAPPPAQPDSWPPVAPLPPEPATATPDESSAATTGVAVMSPVEADNWLSALDGEVSSELLILDVADAADTDEPLVIDVDEEPGGGPATAGPAGALPPLVIDPIHDLPVDGSGFLVPETTAAQAAQSTSVEPSAAVEPRFCVNCGTTLRPGRRFCHQCGEPVAEGVAGSLPETTASPWEAALPRPMTTLPREEWPTIVSSPPLAAVDNAPAAPAAPAPARFCNNCGLGLAADATICPDCGSQDIS
jgi:RNA polymerase subunit RPABC4/transcription elongation factor Spt4